MEKYILEYNEKRFLIDPKDIETEVQLGGGHLVIDGIDVNAINTETLKKQLEEYEESQVDFDKNTEDGLEEFLNHLGYNDIKVCFSDDTMPADDILMYDTHNDEFYNLRDGYEVQLYRWMNGTNLESYLW